METQLLLKMCKGRRKNTGDTANFLELLHHRILGSLLFPRADKACIWQVFSLCLLDKQPLFGLHWHWGVRGGQAKMTFLRVRPGQG